jgi:PucR C-terminal helix-turn-helix domain
VQVLSRGEALRRIVARSDLDDFTERLLDTFWDRPEFQRLSPQREQVRAWVRWNLDLVIRWLIEGTAPTEEELEVFREHARARAADGSPPDMVPGNFRRGARFAWRALLEVAAEEERPALLDSADLLFDFVDLVSRAYSDVYSAASPAPPPSQELAARALLGRICADEQLVAEDHTLTEGLDFDSARASHAFAISASPNLGLTVAARLRQQGVLAAFEGQAVTGLSSERLDWRALGIDPPSVVVSSAPAIGTERGRALEEVRYVIGIAVAEGRSGEVSLDDYLTELLLLRSPRVAARIRRRVYGPLNGELARTLDLLVEHNFERGATAAALPVHRNTLRDRVNRISELTGVDLDKANGRGLAWLAWHVDRHQRGRVAG